MQRRTLLALSALLLCPALPAPAHPGHSPAETRAGEITITHPWTRAAGANANGAGFMTLRNAGAADRLLGASSPAARRVELHTHIREGDVMRMRPVPAIELPAGQSVELRPGGLHLMLIGLTAALPQGGELPLTLRFERAGEVQVVLPVQGAGARGPGAPAPGGHGSGGHVPGSQAPGGQGH